MKISHAEAIRRLGDNEVIGMPTETVYGLAASYRSEKAIKQIFTLKGRPSSNPLILHIAHAADIQTFASVVPEGTEKLIDCFWPGPLTLVLPAKKEVLSPLIRAGLPTIALRLPAHPLARALIEKTGPLVAPSANLSGKPSATTCAHVEEDFGPNFPVLDGGPCKEGLESTIILFQQDSGWQLGRLGAIPLSKIEDLIGPLSSSTSNPDKPLCPGQLLRHYAPKATLILCKAIPPEADVIIGFPGRPYKREAKIFLLGSSPEEVAHNLYTILRTLDEAGILKAHVDIDLPDSGLWSAILERLTKAANS